jgi:tryptophan synthase alpha chain
VSRIADAFTRAQQQHRAALVGYLTAGDPDAAGSRERTLAACEAGLDVLELGVPFSDPTADGPQLQAAMGRALASGMTLAGVLEQAQAVRARFDLPIVLFSYANPLLSYGAAALVRDALAAGIDALLVVDLPPEHAGCLRSPAIAAALDWIGLVAPTSGPERIRSVVRVSTGFVYAVTLKGVTGASLPSQERVGGIDHLLAAIRQTMESTLRLPVVVGFGIRTPEQAHACARQADGVVVGTALVAAARQSVETLRTSVTALRAAMERTPG